MDKIGDKLTGRSGQQVIILIVVFVVFVVVVVR